MTLTSMICVYKNKIKTTKTSLAKHENAVLCEVDTITALKTKLNCYRTMVKHLQMLQQSYYGINPLMYGN